LYTYNVTVTINLCTKYKIIISIRAKKASETLKVF